MNWKFKITKNSATKLNNTDFHSLGFGKTFTDHMFVADYYDGEWRDCRIEPFGDLELHPATFALHYGQSIFEGLKAERSPDGRILVFRPEANADRFEKSAFRLAMPPVPQDLFLQSISELIHIDSGWVPQGIENTSLYIRPFLFGSDPILGVKIGEHFKYVCIIGPVGSYYAEPVNVLIQDKYVRAFPGGTGAAKFSGNYSATLYPVKEAKEQGCNQILWTDGKEHKYFQEIGTMNVFFQIGDTLLTPSLEEDTILHGVTRDSIITLARDKGMKIEERKISVDEVLKAYEDKTLVDMFGAGTAAVVNPIDGFVYKGKRYDLTHLERTNSKLLKAEIEGIKSGKIEDTHGWVFEVPH
jgi:branched-chain amino acid aminotransferase